MIPRRRVRSVLLENGATAAPEATAEQDPNGHPVPTATAEPMTTLRATKSAIASNPKGDRDTWKRWSVFAPVSEGSSCWLSKALSRQERTGFCDGASPSSRLREAQSTEAVRLQPLVS